MNVDPLTPIDPDLNIDKIQKNQKSKFQGRTYKLGVKRYLENLINQQAAHDPSHAVEQRKNKFLKKNPKKKMANSSKMESLDYFSYQNKSGNKGNFLEASPQNASAQTISFDEAANYIHSTHDSLQFAFTQLRDGKFNHGQLIQQLERSVNLIRQGIDVPAQDTIIRAYEEFVRISSSTEYRDPQSSLLSSLAHIFPDRLKQACPQSYINKIHGDLLLLAIGEEISEDDLLSLHQGLELVSIQSEFEFTGSHLQTLRELKDIYRRAQVLLQGSALNIEDALTAATQEHVEKSRKEQETPVLNTNETAADYEAIKEAYSLLAAIGNGSKISPHKMQTALTLLAQANHLSQSDTVSEELSCLRKIHLRYLQITASHTLPKEDALQLAIVLEAYRLPSDSLRSSILKTFTLSLSVFSNTRSESTWVTKINRHCHRLPYSMIMDSVLGKTAILFKKKRSHKLIGEGGFKKVKEALFLPDNPLQPSKLSVEASTEEIASGFQEIHFMNLFGSKPCHVKNFIMRQYTKAAIGKEKIGMIIERYDGPLNRKAGYTFPESVSIAHQVFTGLSQMHLEGIIHGDIKPDNILEKKGGLNQIQIALTDYGLSHYEYEKGRYIGYGTPSYANPSSIQYSDRNSQVNPRNADIWAAALSILEVSRFKTPHLESLKSSFIHCLLNDAPFKQWSTTIYNYQPVSDSVARQAAHCRRNVCQDFFKQVERQRTRCKDQNELREYEFLSALMKILAHDDSQTLNAEEIQEEFKRILSSIQSQ